MNAPSAAESIPVSFIPITRHGYWACCRSGPVSGPHTPYCEGPKLHMPLRYMLKIIERGSCRTLSVNRVAGRIEANAAVRLLGPTNLQAVLVDESFIEFLPASF